MCVRRVRLFGSFATRITLPGSCFDHPLKRLDHPHTGRPGPPRPRAQRRPQSSDRVRERGIIQERCKSE